MVKALASRVKISLQDTDIAVEYYREVEDILFSPEVLRLGDCQQHFDFSRLEHCINVSYYSFLICRRFGLNARAAARAGLLHDLFYYDWKGSGLGTKHISEHPRVALENAEALTQLNDMERDAIIKHMWPMFGIPKYKESFVVTMVDKMCATMEAVDSLWRAMLRDSLRLKFK